MKILERGLGVTAFSMLIVFAALIILYLLIKLQTKVMEAKPKNDEVRTKDETNSNTNTNTNIIKKADIQTQSVNNAENDLEIAAAIMAAICAFTGKSPNELNIKSIRRTETNDSYWRREAISNSIRH